LLAVVQYAIILPTLIQKSPISCIQMMKKKNNPAIKKRAFCSKCGFWISSHHRTYNGNLCVGAEKKLALFDYLNYKIVEN
jgi:hypothetical protein